MWHPATPLLLFAAIALLACVGLALGPEQPRQGATPTPGWWVAMDAEREATHAVYCGDQVATYHYTYNSDC